MPDGFACVPLCEIGLDDLPVGAFTQWFSGNRPKCRVQCLTEVACRSMYTGQRFQSMKAHLMQSLPLDDDSLVPRLRQEVAAQSLIREFHVRKQRPPRDVATRGFRPGNRPAQDVFGGRQIRFDVR